MSTVIPAHSLVTSSSHVPTMICEGVDQPFCLEAYRMVLTSGAMGGCQQGHCVIWADDAGGEWGSPVRAERRQGNRWASRGIREQERSMPLIAVPEGLPQLTHGLE